MMKEAGEEANLVLVRTNDMGVIETSLPSMKVFNHCIAWVPDAGAGKGMFIDGTARYYAAKDLPSMDQGRVLSVRVNPDGSARVVEKGVVTGMDAGMIRQRFQEGAKREREFEQWYGRVFEGLKVEKLSFSDLSRYNLPVEYTAEYTIPRFARPEGRGLSIRPSMFPANLLEEYGQLGERRHDLLLDFPRDRKDRVTFELPKGWKARSLPGAVDRDNPLGAFTWKAKAEGNRIEVESGMTLKVPRIPKGDYKAWRDWAGEIDRTQNEEVIVEPE
jgi:hypothetical protein